MIKKEVKCICDCTYIYNTLGRLTSEQEGVEGSMLSTLYQYDAIGNLSKTTYPDGTATIITRGWGSSANKRYFVKVNTTGQATVTTWYDNHGREVSIETEGEKGVGITNIRVLYMRLRKNRFLKKCNLIHIFCLNKKVWHAF